MSSKSSNTDHKNLHYKNKNKNNLYIQTNSKYFINSPKLKRNKTIDFLYHNHKDKAKKLSKKEKFQINSIIKSFNKKKLATEYLFSKEKDMLLNSVNKSNFNFLFLEEEKNNKANKKKKKNINLSILLSSSMVNKFNNKTSWILDNPFQNNKLSKNIGDFRKQIINSYNNLDRNMESAFLSKKMYQNALDIFDEAEDLKIQKNLKNEEEFYKLKSN